MAASHRFVDIAADVGGDEDCRDGGVALAHDVMPSGREVLANYGPDSEEASWHLQTFRRTAALPGRDEPDWIRTRVAASAAVLDLSPAVVPGAVRPRSPARQSRRGNAGRIRALIPLVAILAAQAGLSARLLWSNTAFNDEAL